MFDRYLHNLKRSNFNHISSIREMQLIALKGASIQTGGEAHPVMLRYYENFAPKWENILNILGQA